LGLLLTPGMADAGPYFGDWTWFGHSVERPDGDYSPLHYWTPSAYELRSFVHPVSLDQFPPGPSPSVPPSYDVNRYRTRGIPPAPSAPYADPEGYYGRPIAP
jgi:hypothetical protein